MRMEYDTSYYFNVIYYPGVTYLEKQEKVRLESIDFKKNKKIVIYTPRIKISGKLTLKELLSKYQYNDDDFGIASYMALFPSSKRKSQKLFKTVAFSTGEHDRINITLYFSPNGKLRMMFIDACDF